MRRALGFILPVLVLAAGCLWSGPFVAERDAGPPAGDPDRTLEYWDALRGVMYLKSKSDDLRALTNVVRRQSDTIRGLPTEGVDPELVRTAIEVAKWQEKVIEIAEVADYELAGLRAAPAVAKQFVEANQRASAAAARLAQLHSRLSARYGVAFVAFEK